VSRKQGHIQRAIAAVFEASLAKNFTTRQLAALAYPGEAIERRHTNAVIRAIPSITPPLTACRVGTMGRLGWHHVWGRA